MRVEHITAAYMLTAENLKFGPQDAGKFLVGVISGLANDAQLTEIQKCVDGASDISTTVKEALVDIGKLDF